MKVLKKIIVICGPTGVGKTSLCLKLAKEFSGEIVSADSRQIYRFLDIGTDKVCNSDRKKIPHHLIDIRNPEEKYTAGDFIRDADNAIAEIIHRANVPFIVGGTGFYIQSLLEGLCEVPPIPAQIRLNLKNEIEEKGSEIFYERLETIDPKAAEKIHPNDKKRIIRALEVYRASGKPLSEYWGQQEKIERYNHFTIYLTDEREELYRRINLRVDRMVEKGLVSEVKKLSKMGYSHESPGMITLSYKEILDFLDGKTDWPKTVDLIKQNMRNYAKRQITWFSKIRIDLTINRKNLNLLNIINQIENFLGENHENCTCK